MLGKHVLMDFRTSKTRRLNDIRYIYDFIEDVSAAVDMTLVAPPLIFRFPCTYTDYLRLASTYPEFRELLEKRRNDFGVSGIGIWGLSHIAIHTWKELGIVSMDAYSCADFEEAKLYKVVERYFPIKEVIQAIVLVRGTTMIHDVRASIGAGGGQCEEAHRGIHKCRNMCSVE